MVDRVLCRRRFVAAVTLAAGVALSSRHASVLAQNATPDAGGETTLGWTDELVDDNGKLNVVTTVAPISSIVRNVGGDSHRSLRHRPRRHELAHLRAGPVRRASSSPRPISSSSTGSTSKLPTMELAEANLREGAEIVSLGEQTITEDEWVFDFSFPEEEGSPNPHLWTNPPYAKRYAEIVAETLSARDPDNAEYYAENLARYSAALDELDAAITEAVETVPEENRKLLTYHDSWAYFAPRYGFVVIGAAQPSDFSEPSPQEVAAADRPDPGGRRAGRLRLRGLRLRVLEQIAQEAGATYIDQLRDDAPPGESNAPEHTYLGMMIRNMDLMLTALGGNADAVTALSPADTYVE